MEYKPDAWVVVKITPKNGKPEHYRVFAGWYGGFTTGDSWKMNSGITLVEDKHSHYVFHGSSGSIYKCYKEQERMSGDMQSIYNGMKDNEHVKVEHIDFADYVVAQPIGEKCI